MSEKVYTVVGVWPDTGQRFMNSIYAESGDEAANKVDRCYPGLMVAGVVRGDHKAADTQPYVY